MKEEYIYSDPQKQVENPKKSHRKLAIISLIAIALLVIILFSPMDNFVSERHDYPELDLSGLNASSSCTNTDTGWECNFNTTEDDWRGIEISDMYKERCNEQGGAWRCYGYCMATYNHYCDFKFDDAGSPCFTSWQCGGKCVKKEGNESFFGECSEYALRTCDSFSEFNFGITSSNFVLCD